MTFNEKITVRMPRELKRELTKQAKARMLHPADVAREALADYLKQRAVTAAGVVKSEAGHLHWKLMVVLFAASVVVGAVAAWFN